VTDHFAQAVEAAQIASRVDDIALTMAETKYVLTAALPHLRRMIAEELRAEGKRIAPILANAERRGAWETAADFVEGK